MVVWVQYYVKKGNILWFKINFLKTSNMNMSLNTKHILIGTGFIYSPARWFFIDCLIFLSFCGSILLDWIPLSSLWFFDWKRGCSVTLDSHFDFGILGRKDVLEDILSFCFFLGRELSFVSLAQERNRNCN